MATATKTRENAQVREEWLRTMEALADQIGGWVRQEPGWTFAAVETQEMEEEPLGKYTITIWRIETPEGEVRLEPRARNYPGRGFFELYAWPTLRRVHLLRDEPNDAWKVRVDAGFSLHQPWDRAHFVVLVNDLIGAEDLIG